MAPALNGAGLRDTVSVVGYTLSVPDEIRKGNIDMSTGTPLRWQGWAAMDTLNRIFNGEEPVDQHIPVRLFDETNIDSIEGDVWEGDVDYRAAYQEIWGG